MKKLSIVATIILSCSTASFAADNAWQKLNDTATKAWEKHDAAVASKNWNDALTEAEKGGDKNPQISATLDNLGKVYQAQKDYPQAEKCFMRSLQIRKSTLPSSSPLILTSLNNVASVYVAEKKYSELNNLYKQEHVASGSGHAVVCNMCESNESLIPIYYGTVTPSIKQQAKAGKLFIGSGLKDKSARWYCKKCESEIQYKNEAQSAVSSTVSVSKSKPPTR